MAEPATGTLAAAVALGTSAGGVAILSTLNTIPIGEFIPGTILAAMGAVGWQFIIARQAREKAAANGTPKDKLPTIDIVSVGYSLFGAPLAAGCVIALVHMFGGAASILSLPGFLVGGAASNTIVTRVVDLFLNMIPGNKSGGQP